MINEAKHAKWELEYARLWLPDLRTLDDLTPAQVEALACVPYALLIRSFVIREYVAGFGYKVLAQRFGVGPGLVRSIVERAKV